LDQQLARLVGRVGLAGKDNLHRAFGPVDRRSSRSNRADQPGALVGGEAAGKPDRQRVGVEQHAEATTCTG
jgi:hypothetical protein